MLWIMSQDKGSLTNIYSVGVSSMSGEGKIQGVSINRNLYNLGQYATEERAKEVLAEIFYLLSFSTDRITMTYEMPLE